MKVLTQVAALLAALLVAGAIVYHAQTQRFQLASGEGGVIVRLDTRTGQTAVCLAHRLNDQYGTVVAPCTGRRDR